MGFCKYRAQIQKLCMQDAITLGKDIDQLVIDVLTGASRLLLIVV